jgi:glycosyltransferase involved in cell wall biosynthesis
VALGYDRRKMTVVPNGCDVSRFTNSPVLRDRARTALGFDREDLVIGTIARFDPHKDLETFVRAAAEVARVDSRVRVLMVGKDLEPGNEMLHAMVRVTGQSARFVLAGQRADPVACFAALDVFCLSSVREGFPNAVVEAMAMEVPCVVTNAGDASRIVGDTGVIVPIGDSTALAEALRQTIDLPVGERLARGRQARARVVDHFSMALVSNRFHALYLELAAPQTSVEADVPQLG